MDSDPLSGLADIHLPEQVGIWPLAPGWWLVIALLLALAMWGALRLMRHLHRLRLRAEALRELERCHAALTASAGSDDDRVGYLNAVNAVLRRVALAHYPSSTVAGLTGKDWMEFLHTHGDLSGLDAQSAEALAFGRFAPRCDHDPEAVLSAARRWISSQYRTGFRSEHRSGEMSADHA